jgi:ribonuclease HII
MNIFESIEIISDDDDNTTPVIREKSKKIVEIIKPYVCDNPNIFEIGVDEAGRGPLFGRVYTGAVILPKNKELFDFSKMKDSKRFHSKKKINEVAEYIKENAISWSVTYADEKVIDDINILQATQKSMHKSILEIMKKTNKNEYKMSKQFFRNKWEKAVVGEKLYDMVLLKHRPRQ